MKRSYNFIDLTGRKFGRWLVLSENSDQSNNTVKWNCVCECGNTGIVNSRDLTHGFSGSCGCLRSKKMSEIKCKDRTGLKYGKWLVIERATPKNSTRRRYAHWLCQCDCGTQRIVPGAYLQSGQSQSCGCLSAEMSSIRMKKCRGDKNYGWKGGRSNVRGYIWLSDIKNPLYKRGYGQFEHRYVMSTILGRPLLENETVHHKNGIRSDNRPENLELRVGHHGMGQTIPDMIKFAHEILDRYESDCEDWRTA